MSDNIHEEHDFSLTPDFGLSALERAVADSFLGAEDRDGKKAPETGNKSRSYMKHYPNAKPATARKRGSELFKRPAVKAYIDRRRLEISKQAEVNAVTVLRESLAHLRVCQGAIGRIQSRVVEGAVIEDYVRDYDAAGVAKALELIGKNINVQAFKDQVDVSGQLNLADVMTRRQQQIEKRAQGVDKEVADVSE